MSHTSALPDRSSRTAYAVWLVAAALYLLAVFHRSSLAVAGLVAVDRFHISAAQLSTFTMLQLVVYASMQIPVGVAIDRLGPRRVILTGAAVLLVAQTSFAFATSYPVAVLARIGVGIGDAMTFICVIRLLASWFPPRKIPVLTQVTGTVGQIGAIVAAIPMTWALGHLGWTRAYLIAALVGGSLALIGVVVLRDSPAGRRARGDALTWTQTRQRLAQSWARPGTRLGFWVHFATPFSANALGMLWGYPFFVKGEGRSPAEAGVLLTVMIVAVLIAGPIMGGFVARHPWERSTLALSVITSMVAAWTVVLAWPGQAPYPVLVALVIVVGIGGPTSVVGFDVARTSNPPSRIASATGIVNVAGFVATFVLVIAIGLVLDLRTPGGGSNYTPSAFRWAMATQYLLWLIGAAQILRYRSKTRAVTDRARLTAGELVAE